MFELCLHKLYYCCRGPNSLSTNTTDRHSLWSCDTFAAFPIRLSSSGVRLLFCDIASQIDKFIDILKRVLLKVVLISFLSFAMCMPLVCFVLMVRPTFFPFSSTSDVSCCSLYSDSSIRAISSAKLRWDSLC